MLYSCTHMATVGVKRLTVQKLNTAVKINVNTSLTVVHRWLATVVPLRLHKWRLNHFKHVVLMVAENPAEIRLRLVGQPLTDRLLMLIGRVFYVPDLSHSAAKPTVT